MQRNHPGGGDLPFVGRARMLDDLRTWFDRGDHVLLIGRSGIGKSRLAHELVHELPTSRVERIFATPVTQHDRLGTLASIGYPSGVDASDIGAMFQWYLSRWRGRMTSGRPIVLWIDDIQHLDELSAAVIRSAVVQGVVQLVATARTTHPRPPDVEALLVEGVVTLIDVPLLDLWPGRSARSFVCSRRIETRSNDIDGNRAHARTGGSRARTIRSSSAGRPCSVIATG